MVKIDYYLNLLILPCYSLFLNFKNDGLYKVPPFEIAETANAKCSGVIAMP